MKNKADFFELVKTKISLLNSSVFSAPFVAKGSS